MKDNNERFPSDVKAINAFLDRLGGSEAKKEALAGDEACPERAVENWVKVHAIVKVDEFVMLSHKFMKSKVHESQVFESMGTYFRRASFRYAPWSTPPTSATPA